MEESTNKKMKALYLRQNMGEYRSFKPNNDCSARFLRFCNEKFEVVTVEYYGTMCKSCLAEAKRMHEKAMAEPCKTRDWKDATFHTLNTSENNLKKSEACSTGGRIKNSGRRRNFSKVYKEGVE